MTMKLRQALAVLLCWIEQGIEYPEAESRVRRQFALSDADWHKVRRAYDAL